MRKFPTLARLLSATALLALPLAGRAQFAPGSLVVVRAESALTTTNLSNAAAPTYLDNYPTSAGAAIGTAIALPSSGTGTTKLTIAGSASSEGQMTLSANGRYLLVGGYNAAAATATVAATASATTQRVVGRVDASKTVDLTTALTNAFSGTSFRSVAGPDGTTLYASGAGAGATPGPAAPGVFSTTFGTTTGTAYSSVAITARVARYFNGEVYFSAGGANTTSAIPPVALTFGIIKTSGPGTESQFIDVSSGNGTGTINPYGFVLFDTDATVGADLAYIADERSAVTGGGIQKWALQGGTWSLKGVIAAATVRGLTATRSGTTVTLYGTSPTIIFKAIDTALPGAAPSVTTATSIATISGSYRAFRGIALAPHTLQVSQAATDYPSFGTAYNFGTVAAGATSPAVTFTLTNSDGTAATGVSIATTGDFASSGTNPTMVAANGTTTFDLTFSPTAPGTRTGTAVITYTNGTGTGSYTLNLTGQRAFTQSLAVTRTSTGTSYPNNGTTFSFGNQNLNVASSAVNFTLTSDNTSDATSVSIATTGDFATSGTNPTTVVASSTAAFNLTFTPTGTGLRTGTAVITYTNSGGTGTYTVNLSGTGVANPSIAVSQGATPLANNNSPAFSGFATTQAGNTSASVAFTITNSGPDPLSLSSFTASGGEFVTSGTNPTTVLAGGTATFNVVFQPATGGTRTGSITIANNSQGTPSYVLNFSGTGTALPAAVPFAAGNLVIARVGNGASTLTSSASPVFLDEYTTAAAQTSKVQSLLLPTAASGGNQAFTIGGSTTTDGALVRSPDGQYLTLAGYNAAPGTATLSTSTAATNPRVVARVGIGASVDVSTVLTGAFSGTSVRGAVTSNGVNIWATGGSGGVNYTTLGSTAAPTVVSSTVTIIRTVNIFEGQLYFSTGSGTTGIYKVGTGTPTSGPVTATLLVATGSSPYGFVLLDRDPTETGLDVLYVVDEGGTLSKYSKTGGVWAARGSATLASGYRGLTGRVSGVNVELYLTSTGLLSGFVDATAKNTSLTGAATLTTLATAATNTAFRGVAFAPEPLDLVADATTGPVSVDGGTFRNISVNDATLTSTSGLVASGSVTVGNGGLFNPGCTALTGTASFTLQAGGTLGICNVAGISASGNTGTVQTTGARSFSSDATYLYNGSVLQNTGAGLPTTVRGLTVANPAGVSLSQPTSVTQLVRLTNGSLASNGNLTLLSVRGGGTALVYNEGSGSVTGSGTMQRAVDILTPTNDGYHHYSSPVSNTTINDLATPGFNLVLNPDYNTAAMAGTVRPFPTVYGYDESRVGSTTLATDQNAFEQGYYSPSTGTSAVPMASAMTVGSGYTALVPNALIEDFTGTFNTGTKSISGLTRGNNNASGWQLLGNPYPSPLDWSGVTKTGVDAAMYVYHATSTYGGYYSTYLGLPNGTTIAGSPIIDAGQGFFARTTTPGTPGTVSFANANRVTSFGTQPAFGRQGNTLATLMLELSGAGTSDAAYVYFNAAATTGVDAQYDAVKMSNTNGLNLATVSGTQRLAIDGRPQPTTATVLPLFIGVPATGSYTLRPAQLTGFGTTAVYLRDALTGTRTLLTGSSSYRFAMSSYNAPGRFSLEFAPAGTALATAGQALAAQVQLYPNPSAGRFHVVLPAGAKAASVTVTNALGQVVLTRTLAGNEADFSIATPGVYTLRLTVDGNAVTRKVVVE